MPDSIGVVVTKVGRLWSAGREAIVARQCAAGVAAAGEHLEKALKDAAPVASSAMRQSIQLVGRGVARRVRVGVWQAIPVDKGYQAGHVSPQELQKWVEIKGLASGQQARSMAFAISRARRGKRVKGREWFYATYDRLQPVLFAQYLGPIAQGIVAAL